MASIHQSITVDVRKVAKEHLTFSVQYKNLLWFKIGVLVIRLGCWMTGATFVDEFPMSLYQSGEHN